MLSYTSGAWSLTPDETVERSDRIRFPDEDYIATVQVFKVRDGTKDDPTTFEVMVKGRDYAIVKTTAPASQSGRLMLMRGKDLWAYLPSISKPLRISLRERLLGEASNADITRANFAGDYAATFARTEESKGKKYDVLELVATEGNAAYAKVEYWVEQETYNPYHAKFFAISGRQLKTCTYGNYRMIGGAMRPTRLVMTDALNAKQYTVIDYMDIVKQPLSEKMFTEENLKRINE